MSDKKTIGLTDKGRQTLDSIFSTGYFKEELDIARFALAVALDRRPDVNDRVNAKTVWNVGSFDPSKEIANIIQAFYPEVTEPYRIAEILMDQGLELLQAHIREKGALHLDELLAKETSHEESRGQS